MSYAHYSSAISLALLLATAASSAVAEDRALSPYIDAHTHIDKAHAAEAVEDAVRSMPAENSAKYLFLPSPFPEESARSFDIEVIQAAAKKYPGKVAMMGGGGTLNPMLQHAFRTGSITPEIEKRFRDRAHEIVRLGAVGFGEMSSEHRPSESTPSYQSAPPDHPLLLMLADIAAESGLPITLHLEAVPETMPVPASWKVDGLTPPPELRANIAALERLLAHNSRAKIVWAHGGWDNTGFRTPGLCRQLLQAHLNLYMELKIDPKRPGLNSPLTGGASGALKPEWLALFRDFSDRFVIGTDQHYPQPHDAVQRWQGALKLFNELPDDLRRKFGTENVHRIYKLD